MSKEPSFQLICYSKYGTPSRCGLYWTREYAEEAAKRHVDFDTYFRFEIFYV